MIMDVIKSPYRQGMRLYIDRPDIVVPGSWHFAQPGAKIIPYFHLYGSASWDEDTIDYEDFGDSRMQFFRTIKNVVQPGMTGQTFLGSKFHWTVGSFFRDAGVLGMDEDDQPYGLGIDPSRPGGDGDGGTAVQGRNEWQTGFRGDADAGDATQYDTTGTVLVGAGGDSEGGAAVQVWDTTVAGSGGDSDDGAAVQVWDTTVAGGGGDSDDGTASQVWDTSLTGSGGDSDDGEATQAVTDVSITVEDIDGVPSYPSIITLQFDQADGFAITNPSAGVVRIDFAGSSYTDEMAQDAVGGILTDTATIDFTYNDGANTITADVKANSITTAMMHASATDVLFGRSTAGAGAGEEIACTAFGRSLIDDTDAATMRATLGLGALAVLSSVPSTGLPTSIPTLASITPGPVPQWGYVDIAYTDLSAAATTNTITAYTQAAGVMVHLGFAKVTTKCQGGAISAYVVQVGYAGTITEFVTNYNCFSTVSDTNFTALLGSLSQPRNFGSSTAVQIKATSSGANLNAATQGVVRVFLQVAKAI